ncbi:MAG TPA: 23S rRNA (pseudouridine(1915)-N(3))-methyltransferase RlmH [Arcobacter sp.]|nr:23S rRNA (pseudouridine(1915)-N(3))-methyltransferase RlmH [Arcobacter sp.]HIP55838.1 23S rRNA (pseudouridine(1915)-N(3))-methyltransferase RlmH [Arcobacter sp.]
MKINIYQIAKNDKDEFEPLIKNFIKMSSKYANVEIHNLFNKQIGKAQTIGEKEAKTSYSDVFEPKLKGFNIALDVLGKQTDSYKFSELISDNTTINFFIGGAFGLQKEFLNKCDKVITLSDLTMAHKIANIVLLEQIFRGLCIANNHPYHK